MGLNSIHNAKKMLIDNKQVHKITCCSIGLLSFISVAVILFELRATQVHKCHFSLLEKGL